MAPPAPTRAAVPLLHPASPFSRWLQGPEYDFFLPALGRLPRPLAYALAHWRGRVNARHDRDWVSLAHSRPHVSRQTRLALAELVPAEQIERALLERYRTLAREEFETRLLARHGLAAFEVQADAALDALARRPSDCGLLLLTAHFETFMVGVAALAARGERVHLVISSVTADPRLHPSVRRHFQLKYEGVERLLNGGRLLEVESHSRHYYRALRAGEVVVMLSDAPALSPETGVWLHWMGRTRAVAQGALRMAATTRCALGGFACHHLGGRRHRLELSPLYAPAADEAAQRATHAGVFAFLEQHIQQTPARWWGMHLLPHYPVRPAAAPPPAP